MGNDIRHDPESQRFTTKTDHGQAVLAYSEIEPGTLDYRSTVVPAEDRGQGIGEELVLFALAWARENDLHVIPSCPFVKRVIEEHPEHQPTIASG